MGRDPGMLIRIRVVRVVSVFGSSDRRSPGPSPAPSVPPSGPTPWAGEPYGGVPDGYAAPARP
ncbi:hypothetical protein CP982_27200 [Streptomyces spectabilis]|uniref:Uncharacterized protein n=1 Tax=Streptomyces spectabilis TaxID=68270 RepID=A0A5P2XP20_STRST|nr:hypothetical protein CP982_27200 [Streptomyces spectabilis]